MEGGGQDYKYNSCSKFAETHRLSVFNIDVIFVNVINRVPGFFYGEKDGLLL